MIQRDKLCKDGERFVSPAILVTRRHLQQELDEERKKKAEAEAKEDAKRREEEKNAPANMVGSTPICFSILVLSLVPSAQDTCMHKHNIRYAAKNNLYRPALRLASSAGISIPPST